MRRRSATQPPTPLATWSGAVALATAAVWFVHECAHGLGYSINGASVSTGFNLVGSHGKAPGDPGFRAGVPVTGTPNLGTLLGPTTNWVIAAAATAGFLRRPRGRRGLILAATAVGAALPRALSVATFFVPAAFGRVVYQDEVEWGAHHVHALAFPTTLERFEAATRAHPGDFLTTPVVYIWPMVSLLICGAAVVLVYRRMRQVQAPSFGRRWRLAVAAPFAAWAVVGIVFAGLDRVVRINW